MALIDRNTDFNNLIKLSPSGLTIANFPQIKIALENLFKNIYGQDIDISTGTADGIYIETLSILINNILQTFKVLYTNLDVNTAYGQYLDLLCSLSNVTRKQATKSTCYLQLTLKDTTPITPDSLSFLDNNGNIWKWENDIFNKITFHPNKPEDILVKCETLGRITALIGSINRLVENEYVFEITQKNNAVVGESIETDFSLRARRNQTLGNSGLTVLDSLKNALSTHPDIRDVKIINNNTGQDILMDDKTNIKNHNIYVVIRKYDINDTSSDKEIATIIQNKLTPGILTQKADVSVLGGNGKQREFFIGDTPFKTIVSWKESTGVFEDIEIKVKPLNYFSTDVLEDIGYKLMEYINNLRLDEDLDLYKIRYYATINDIKFKGFPTYQINDVKFTNKPTEQVLKNTLTHFEYNNVKISSTNPGLAEYTITLTKV